MWRPEGSRPRPCQPCFRSRRPARRCLIKRDPTLNTTNLAAADTDADDWGYTTNAALDRVCEALQVHDPLTGDRSWCIDDAEAFQRLAALDPTELRRLFALVVGTSLTAHRSGEISPLHAALAEQLQPDVRATWTPGQGWLKRYGKADLLAIIADITGGPTSRALAKMKKTELVAHLATLFEKAKTGDIADEAVRDRANRWLPETLCRGERGQ